MAFDMTVALFVTDQARYAEYRASIAPLLEAAGAAFRYDFDVAKTLKSETGDEFNRVFTLRFPSKAAQEQFFADPRYREIRGRLFEGSVARTASIAAYEG